MSDIDPLYEVNPYTGASPADQLNTMGDSTNVPRENYHRVSTPEEYERVPPGAIFIDPEGNARRKPLPTVSSEKEYAALPEGARYIDPEGNERQKPKYEAVNFTAQALHSMAINPKEQRRALEYVYPGKVHESPEGDLLVDDDGVMRKAGATRGLRSFLGAIAAATAPTVGAVLGAIGGGVAAAPTGPGAVAGAAAGGAAGGAAGQLVNDAILGAIAGHDRTLPETAANLGIAAISGGAGTGVGRGVAQFVPSIKAGVSNATAAAPGAMRYFFGSTKEGLERAENLSQRGYAVPPSAYAPEAPHLQNIVETLDPAFRTDKPLVRQNVAAYNKEAGDILEKAGVPEFQSVDDLVRPSLTDPTAAIPTARVGEAMKEKAILAAQNADEEVRRAFAARREALAQGVPDTESQRQALLRAQDNARRAVDNLLNENYATINREVEGAYQLARAGANSGSAWAQVAERFRETRRAIGERATQMYNHAHELGGDYQINSAPLYRAANDFAAQLPEEVRQSQPAIVRRLQQMAGEIDAETGAYIREPSAPTFAQLHELRTLIRSNADFTRLNSDVKNGAYKHFNNIVDETLQNTAAIPELRAAAEALNRADAFYREQIPIFNARQIQAVMKGMEAGEPANPVALYKTLVTDNSPELNARLRQMVGPNLWSAVQAAQVDDLMRRSASRVVPGQIDGVAFARNVLEDYNSGLLTQVQDRAMVDRLMGQVNALAMSRGKIDIPVQPGDRLVDAIARARTAEQEAKQFAAQDPLKFIEREGKRITAEENKALAAGRRERSAEPLGFLFDAKVGTQEAADRILAKPDLMIAARDMFGAESAEFKLLQQAYLWKVLQGDMNPGKALAKIAPEIQHVMFPNATLKQLQELAKDMDFLADTKLMRGAEMAAGQSMMATAKVEHPPVVGPIRKVARNIPGAHLATEAVARSALGKMYSIIASKTAQNPAFFTYLLRGLRGTPEERAFTKQALEKVLQRGSATGAGAFEGAYQMGGGGQSTPLSASE